jgi:hypothetical protein
LAEELFTLTTKKTTPPQAPQRQVPEVIDLEQAETEAQKSLDYWIGRRDVIRDSKALAQALEQQMRNASYSLEVLELAFVDIKSNYQKQNISFNVPPPPKPNTSESPNAIETGENLDSVQIILQDYM